MYKHITTKIEYDKLLASGMFWEFHPELTGNWEKDKKIINKDKYVTKTSTTNKS